MKAPQRLSHRTDRTGINIKDIGPKSCRVKLCVWCRERARCTGTGYQHVGGSRQPRVRRLLLQKVRRLSQRPAGVREYDLRTDSRLAHNLYITSDNWIDKGNQRYRNLKPGKHLRIQTYVMSRTWVRIWIQLHVHGITNAPTLATKSVAEVGSICGMVFCATKDQFLSEKTNKQLLQGSVWL